MYSIFKILAYLSIDNPIAFAQKLYPLFIEKKNNRIIFNELNSDSA